MSNTIPQDVPQFKRCAKCGIEFPATKEFFHVDRQKRDGFTSRCKTCISPNFKNKPHSIEDIPEGHKKCTKCNKLLPATLEFWSLNKRSKDGFTSWCRECYREYSHQYEKEKREPRRERQRQYERKYFQTHKAERSQYRKQYYALHREELRQKQQRYDASRKEERQQYRAEHRERILQNLRRYAAEHKEERRQYRILHRDLARQYHNQRRAKKRAASGTYTAEQVQEQYKRQKGKCYYCRQKVEWGKHHTEHVIPLSRGGSNDISNIVIACPFCNISKHNRLPHEWPEGGRLC